MSKLSVYLKKVNHVVSQNSSVVAGLLASKRLCMCPKWIDANSNSHRIVVAVSLGLMFSPVAKSGNTSTLLYLRDAEKSAGGGSWGLKA